MSNVEDILRESIESKCGPRGLMRFNAVCPGSFGIADCTQDLPGICEAINNAFPADQAAAIVATVREKLETGGQPSQCQVEVTASAGSPGGESQDVPPVFARYFNVDPKHFRDIVNEARRMRAAMGKSTPSQWAPHEGNVAVAVAPEVKAPAENAAIDMAAGTPLPEKALAPPARVIPEPISAIDGEIAKFAYGSTAYSSIDIMDFIRYLKDKGYSFQEYIVLEKIYVTIEKRKKQGRSAIEKEVEGLIDATQAPAEPEIRGFFGQLSEAGLVFEEEDVRRMIRGVIHRKA